MTTEAETKSENTKQGFFKRHRCVLYSILAFAVGGVAGYGAATYSGSEDETTESDEGGDTEIDI